MSTNARLHSRSLEQRLAEAEATIEALLSDQIDAVVDSKSQTPVLLGKAQDALRASEERYRRIVETANEGVWLVDAGNKTTFMNLRMAQMLGCEADMGVGRSPFEFLDEAGRAAMASYLQRPVAQQVEVRYVRTDGTSIGALVAASPFFDSAGRYDGSLAMVMDITEQRTAREQLIENATLLRTAGRVARLGGWTLQLPDRTLTWSDETCAIHDVAPGYSPTFEEGLGYYLPENRTEVVRCVQACERDGTSYDLELPKMTASGRRIWVRSIGEAVRDAEGKITHLQGAFQDITAWRDAEAALQETTAALVERTRALEQQAAVLTEQAALLDLTQDAIIVRNMENRIVFWSRGAEAMYGWAGREALGRNKEELLRTEFSEPIEYIEAKLLRQGRWEGEAIHHKRDGTPLNIASRWTLERGPDGAPARILTINNDVTERSVMALQMAHSAEHDFLTDLPNRMFLNDRINQAIAAAPRHMKKVAVLFLDLDGFKHINDSLGHPIGDKLLQSVAKRLVGCVRAVDTVSRQGGDEFVVLLSEVAGSEDPAVAARRMLQTVAEAQSIDQHDLHVTASVGVSVYPDDGLDAETLIKNADTAMYQAKESGRQCYKFFKPAMNVRAVERQSIEESLRRALERQEFTLHYQPKVNLMTGQITGAEALIRWTHPTRGPVSPGQFIPVAEDSGLILPIGKWVLGEACRQARSWENAGLPFCSMAANISAVQLRDENFLEDLFETLEDTRLAPGSLELELTESVLMKHAEAAESILKAVRARGVQVAIDDFGTGYSSLSYLTKFPIDALKIDQLFVRQITTTPDETSIVTAVIGMARSLKLRVVAEGVENPEELAFLHAHQCDEAQGYYFSRPVPAEQFAKLLETGVSERFLPFQMQSRTP